MSTDRFHMWILAAVFYCGVIISGYGVSGVPIDIEHNETPFPLELQPPLIDNLQDAVDSYGNPIKFSQPIETPDGRKVISAQGVQFEIPNYASGITEIKKPIDSLLPPVIDPIAVAQPNDAENDPDSNDSAPEQYTLPDWLASFNDPDVGPGVPYVPQDDANSLKVLSWDLVPPQRDDPETATSHFGSGSGQQKKLHVTLSPGQSYAFNRNAPATERATTTTPRWRATSTTTTTHRPITTRTTRTTTTTTTTTPRPTTTTTTTTTAPPPTTTTTTTTTTTAPISSSSNSDEIYALPGGNAQFLPSWLEGFDDPELNIALPFEVPEDNNEYNHTISLDLLPPLGPYEDLKVLSVPELQKKPTPAGSFASITTIPSTAITIPTTIRTTTIKPHPSTPTTFQFKFFSKQTISPPTPTTQKPSFFTAPTATSTTTTTTITPSTTTESAISNRISQITLKSAAQPSGFKSNFFLASQPTVAVPVKPTVPPLPVLDFKNNPFFASKFGGFSSASKTSTTSRTTTTTTTTTTTKAPTTSTPKEFLFDSATIPSWLSDVKDPALGPGVPFTLAGGVQSQRVQGDLQQSPLKQVDEQTIDGVTIQRSISSELPPLSFPHNSIPSQSVPTTQPFTATTVQEPSKLFTPPIVVASDDVDDNTNSESQTNSISINNFAAVTEPSTKTTPKVTFNKSDQGKVISNTVFAPRQTQQTTKPFFGQALPAAPSGFTSATAGPGAYGKPTTASSVFNGKYTGGFGGAPGTLGGQNKPGYAIQADGSIIDPDYTVRPLAKATVPPVPVLNAKPLIVAALPALPSVPKATATTIPKRAYTGTFGGPPGVLTPFDNANLANK